MREREREKESERGRERERERERAREKKRERASGIDGKELEIGERACAREVKRKRVWMRMYVCMCQRVCKMKRESMYECRHFCMSVWMRVGERERKKETVGIRRK